MRFASQSANIFKVNTLEKWCFSVSRVDFKNVFLNSHNTNNTNISQMCEICLKLTVKVPEWRHWRRSCIFIFSSEHVSCLFSSVSIVDFEQVNVSWVFANIWTTNNDSFMLFYSIYCSLWARICHIDQSRNMASEFLVHHPRSKKPLLLSIKIDSAFMLRWKAKRNNSQLLATI